MSPPADDSAPSPSLPDQLISQYHPVWKDGDFTLVSADGVHFRVSSSHLFSASTVFREAPASGSRFLRFSDERLETAEVLEVVLSLIVQARLLSSVVDDDDDFRPTSLMLNLWVDAVSFMTKWDCVSTLRVFELCVKELILCNHIDARPAFQLGLLADSPGICRAALEASEREGRAALSPYSSERRYIEIEELPFSFWEKVNPRYICALARAGAIKRADEAANFSTSLGRLFMLQLVVIEREQERRDRFFI